MPTPQSPETPQTPPPPKEPSPVGAKRKRGWIIGGIVGVIAIAAIGSGVAISLGNTQSQRAIPSTAAASNTASSTLGQSLSVTGSATASYSRDSSAFKLDDARAVLLTTKDSSKALYILNPVSTTRAPARAATSALGASAKHFKLDKKACLPLLLAGSSTASFNADPEPNATIYLMQDDQSADDGPDVTASQSARTFETTQRADSYTSTVATSLSDCDEVITQTAKSALPVSQEFTQLKLHGAAYVQTAFLASVTDYADATATAVLRKGNLVTSVTVQTSSSSHKSLTKALAKAVSIVDAKLEAI